MKTTLVLPDPLVAQLKREAAETDRSMSEIVEEALRAFFQHRKGEQNRPVRPIPTKDMGEASVDINDREALYRKMGGRW